MTRQNACRRCGECCLGGGPALHAEDMPLFEQGILDTGGLVTLRKGEPAFDQPAGMVAPLEQEIVKLGYASDGKACQHYQATSKSCGIYDNRPLECRLQACWNPAPLAAIYDKNRLARADLLPPESAAMQLARLHEEQCDFSELSLAISRLHESPGPKREAEVLEFLERDAAIRAGLVRRLEQPRMATQGYCLFLFGRPMRESLPYYGLRLTQEQGHSRLLRWRPVARPKPLDRETRERT